jgi:hypothetical protein
MQADVAVTDESPRDEFAGVDQCGTMMMTMRWLPLQIGVLSSAMVGVGAGAREPGAGTYREAAARRREAPGGRDLRLRRSLSYR